MSNIIKYLKSFGFVLWVDHLDGCVDGTKLSSYFELILIRDNNHYL